MTGARTELVSHPLRALPRSASHFSYPAAPAVRAATVASVMGDLCHGELWLMPYRNSAKTHSGPGRPEQQRQPRDLPLRVTLLTTTAPVTDANSQAGTDFAFPLRDRAGVA
jgi:hypothetical protein